MLAITNLDETESFELGDRTYMLSSPKQRFEFIAREYYQYNVAYEVWNKLYKFQRDGVMGAIDKIEKYGGCIIADSVGLGKTCQRQQSHQKQ